MRNDDIRKQAQAIRDRELTIDQEIALMQVEALCELNSTLMFIKNNLR